MPEPLERVWVKILIGTEGDIESKLNDFLGLLAAGEYIDVNFQIIIMPTPPSPSQSLIYAFVRYKSKGKKKDQ